VSVSLANGVRQPKVYGYTISDYADTPWVGSRTGKGLIKVGYTDRAVAQRIKEQLNAIKLPVTTPYDLLLVQTATTVNGLTFTDKAVHASLKKAGVHNVIGEWFEATKDEVLAAIEAVRAGTRLESLKYKHSFEPRPEQLEAVKVTAAHFRTNADPDNPPHFLWNAKMRFGKTFTTYQLAKKLGWTRILVLTYKPAVETAWREDLETHVDFEDWRFKGKDDPQPNLADPSPVVWFASFQDVLGTGPAGEPKIKNTALYVEDWDVVVVDEYHFGAWRDAAKSLYSTDREEHIEGDSSEKDAVETPDLDEDFTANVESALALTVHNYLYLSGTPFRALLQGEFLENEIYNWTYSDEQDAKKTWSGPDANPYISLPQMVLMTYEMPDALREVALNNQAEFSLTEFFRVGEREDGSTGFLHEYEVQKWLNLLRGEDITNLWASVSAQNRPPLPFEDTNLLTALQHTVWYLPNVAACDAMAELLRRPHNTFFNDYRVIVAAGTKAGLGDKALPPVAQAIGGNPANTKTITLSCGKLMTGVTVPAWAGILMLRELKSPESYFQAAFRVQSPWKTTVVDAKEGGTEELVLKEQCYVIDFAPNRALRQVVEYATKLRSEPTSEKDDEKAVEEFMEFLPVLAFSGYAMSQLKASDVLDYLTSGISASMLARRWNSPELITLDLSAMEAILDNAELLASLETIEMYRGIGNDLTALIAANKELKLKKLTKAPLSSTEKKTKTEAEKKRASLKEKLRRFITRLPAFMYLTDDRERTVKDIITQIEPELFVKTTGLTIKSFGQLVDAGVFHAPKMNDAVWKFRTFEEPSLRYGSPVARVAALGGWDVRRDVAFARLVDEDWLQVGLELRPADSQWDVTVTVSEDYGLVRDGIRYETPDIAAKMASQGAIADGWAFWVADTSQGTVSLADLLGLSTT